MDKERILISLKTNMGIISNVCEETDITLDEFNYLIESDIDFAKKAKQIEDFCLDFVESKLYKLINDENVSAISFYLKEKGARRGYGNKQPENKHIKEENIEDDNLFGNFE